MLILLPRKNEKNWEKCQHTMKLRSVHYLKNVQYFVMIYVSFLSLWKIIPLPREQNF